MAGTLAGNGVTPEIAVIRQREFNGLMEFGQVRVSDMLHALCLQGGFSQLGQGM